jgi:hypothetical protein
VRHAVLVSVALGGISLGCSDAGGGGGGSASCASDASCGGDVVGTWTIVQACNATASVAPGACAQRTDTFSEQAQSGTLVFRADGTATETLRTTGTLTEMTPPVCLASTSQTCADIDAEYKSLVQAGSSYTSANCTDNAGTCVCTLTFDTTTNVSGTYTTSGSTLTVTSNGSATASYCVTGSTLVFSVATATGDPPSVYVLTRQ